MNTYAVFLRGINIGGHTRISMQQLKQELTSKGFSNVKTHLNSGNLIVTKLLNATQTASEIAGIIKTQFNSDVEVFVKTSQEMEQILEKDPFKPDEASDASKKIVFLLSEKIKDTDLSRALENQKFEEKWFVSGDVMFVYYPNGSGTSKFTINLIERKMKIKATGRNWNTMTAMVKKMKE
ncbi:MAG TPA: DUF1697 domain-containing protein [Bacteroidales bacterium]|nr:DUF1697 domain-containing protein [Bacteroidales bacterium]